MFGSHVYNYAFIDKDDTSLLWDKPRSSKNRWVSSVYLADLLVLLFQEKFAP